MNIGCSESVWPLTGWTDKEYEVHQRLVEEAANNAYWRFNFGDDEDCPRYPLDILASPKPWKILGDKEHMELREKLRVVLGIPWWRYAAFDKPTKRLVCRILSGEYRKYVLDLVLRGKFLPHEVEEFGALDLEDEKIQFLNMYGAYFFNIWLRHPRLRGQDIEARIKIIMWAISSFEEELYSSHDLNIYEVKPRKALDMGLARLDEQARRRAAERERGLRKEFGDKFDYLRAPILPDMPGDICQLISADDISNEGLRMENCAGSLMTPTLKGRLYLLHVGNPAPEGVLVQVSLNGNIEDIESFGHGGKGLDYGRERVTEYVRSHPEVFNGKPLDSLGLHVRSTEEEFETFLYNKERLEKIERLCDAAALYEEGWE